MSTAIDPDDRIPRRTLDKREAVRHLIHTAIRLIAAKEDPLRSTFSFSHPRSCYTTLPKSKTSCCASIGKITSRTNTAQPFSSGTELSTITSNTQTRTSLTICRSTTS
jgi:hypothetical protein